MGKRIRVRGKRRRKPDIDKLAFAVLHLLEQQAKEERPKQTRVTPAAGGEGSAA